MAILDRLWNPATKDIVSGGGGELRRFVEFASAAALSTGVGTPDSVPCPNDKIRLITGIDIAWVAGAAQAPLSGQVVFYDAFPSLNIQTIIGGMPAFNPGASSRDNRHIVCDWVMFPGDHWVGQGQFSAGAASNYIDFYLMGWEFPRGTLQR